jgi:hypothetical protein
MAGCCTPSGYRKIFGERTARRDLRKYRRRGLDKAARRIADFLVGRGVAGDSVLEVGGGIGAIQLELLASGLGTSVSVDASEAYVATAREEAVRRGFGDRTSHRFGTLADVQTEVASADVVTLDRVVCCSSDLPALLGTAAERARRMVGLVYPRPTWWNRLAARVMNTVAWLVRDRTRWHLHPEEQIRGILRDAGFERRDVGRSFVWQVALYVRPGDQARVSPSS